MNKELIIQKLNNNEVVAHPTDTVFGLIVKIDKKNITKLNKIKQREENKPLQILFASIKDAAECFKNDYFVMNYISNNYKSKTSYIVRAKDSFNNKYLLNTFERKIMFRIPEGEILEVIKEVGPLFASSANLHDDEPMMDNKLIEDTFNIAVSDIKQKSNKASYIISLIDQEISEIR